MVGLDREGGSGGGDGGVETELGQHWGREVAGMEGWKRMLVWQQGGLEFGVGGSEVDCRTRSPITELAVTTATDKVEAKCDYHQNHENRHCSNDADEQGDG